MPTQTIDPKNIAVIVNNEEEAKVVIEWFRKQGYKEHEDSSALDFPFQISSYHDRSFYKFHNNSRWSMRDLIPFSTFLSSISEKWEPKVGDWVECVDTISVIDDNAAPKNLTSGLKYQITEFREDNWVSYINDAGYAGTANKLRFHPCPPPEQKEERKVTGYKRIKDYPGFDKNFNFIAVTDKHERCWCKDWPEYWQPQYAPTSISLTLGSGKRQFRVSGEFKIEYKACSGNWNDGLMIFRAMDKIFNPEPIGAYKIMSIEFQGETYTRAGHEALKKAIESTK